MDMMREVVRAKQMARDKGFIFKKRSNGHMQIFGDKLVNWWPYSLDRTAHVNLSKSSVRGICADKVIKLACGVKVEVKPKEEEGFLY